jgi:hypothetical protein
MVGSFRDEITTLPRRYRGKGREFERIAKVLTGLCFEIAGFNQF